MVIHLDKLSNSVPGGAFASLQSVGNTRWYRGKSRNFIWGGGGGGVTYVHAAHITNPKCLRSWQLYIGRYAVVTPLRKVATYEPRIKDKLRIGQNELRDINEDVHVNAP